MPQCYKLVYGTLEIDGVRMHQTKNKTPLEDARDRVEALGARQGDKVLDVCTGLGYSATEFARRGCRVTTVEKDANVLEIAKENKDSRELFNNPGIRIVNDDALTFVPSLEPCSFDVICHDPPRLSMAGELYSGAFYQELCRVLKNGGRLFHYVGSPGSKSGKNVAKGVKERLQQAGFVGVAWDESLQGFLAEKK